jgi:DegV family protein with EDD domain
VSGIRVVTDSAADLPEDLLERYAITVVPLEVRVGGQQPGGPDGLSAEEFWERFEASGGRAETSAPSPGAFAAAYRDAARDGADGVVCVTLSGELSGTYQSATAGASECAGEIAVQVVDSRTVTMAEGFVALAAAESALEGADLATAIAAAHGAVPKVSVTGALAALDTLRRGGRIGTAQAFFGSLLSVKPIITVRDGVVEGESRQRTRGRSLRYLADKASGAGPLRRAAIAHAAADDLEDFVALLHDARPDVEPVVTLIGPVIGAHAGPGTIGLCLERA